MDAKKIKKLEAAGYRVGTVQQFLNLSDEESALIDLKTRLFHLLVKTRKAKAITQTQLAELIGSSQSRIAKMEAGDPHITVDLYCRALFAMGVSHKDIGKTLLSKPAA